MTNEGEEKRMKGNKKMESEVSNSSKQISEKKQDIKFDTRDYVINYLVQEYAKDNFYIPLDYQRNFIWGDKQKCNFIESILMGLPIPFMFFADTDDGRIEIVDGAQRTRTLIEFAQNDLCLNNLSILTESNGFYFQDLDPAVQRRFLNNSIRVVFLEEGTTEQVRQEIFKRINTGGIMATPAESRRGSYEGDFKDFLERCTKNELFNQLAPRTKLTEDRYEGFELVSRFFAYFEGYHTDFEDYTGSVTDYIDFYIERKNRECSENKELVNQYEEIFTNMLNYAKDLLGGQGFRKLPTSKSTPRARFEALAVGIALAIEEKNDLEVTNVDWLQSEAFMMHTRSDAANNKSRLLGRINYVKDQLLGDRK
jgi:uncharacterized protein with ParB-like and HNH nuclease domain